MQAIATLKAFGRTDAQIAKALNIAFGTVRGGGDDPDPVVLPPKRLDDPYVLRSTRSENVLAGIRTLKAFGQRAGGVVVTDAQIANALATSRQRIKDVKQGAWVPPRRSPFGPGGAPGPTNPTDVWDPVTLTWKPRPIPIVKVTSDVQAGINVLKGFGHSDDTIADAFINVLVGADKRLNIILGGEDETISARVGRRRSRLGTIIADGLDVIDPGHTFRAVAAGIIRVPMPAGMQRHLSRGCARRCACKLR
jgi:hypothetical protein